jgi:hypothetical protein
MAIVYYHISEDTNSLFYVGISKHEERARFFFNRSAHWKNYVAKHGVKVEIVHTDIDWGLACQIESYLIRYYGRQDQGGILINRTDGGEGAVGRIYTQQHRDRIGNAHRGKTISKEARAKQSAAMKGRKKKPFTAAHNLAISIGNKGKPKSAEHIAALKAAQQKRFKENPGLDDETKEKIRIANTGRKHSPESIQRMSAAQKGKYVSSETRAKQSVAAKARYARGENSINLKNTA